MAEVGVSIQHDANHGAYSRNTSLEYLLGTTLDMVGASSFMWKQQHVVGHHTYTNVEGLDPDIRVKDPDVRRVSQHQPWQSYQVSFPHVFKACDLPLKILHHTTNVIMCSHAHLIVQCHAVQCLTSQHVIIKPTFTHAFSLHLHNCNVTAATCLIMS